MSSYENQYLDPLYKKYPSMKEKSPARLHSKHWYIQSICIVVTQHSVYRLRWPILLQRHSSFRQRSVNLTAGAWLIFEDIAHNRRYRVL